MSRQRVSDTSLLPNRNCLGQTCGTNIDTEDVEFTNQQPNLVFIDKVFSFNEDTASPILFNLNTGGPFARFYTTRLFLDGCSLLPCTLSPNAVFEIDNSFVVVEYFNTRPPGNINAAQVTLDGFPVDFVSFANGQYTARTQNVLTRVQNDRCLDRGLPTKVFFLLSNAGPWDFRATFVLEGTVNTNGRNCRFRVEISNAPNSPNTPLPAAGLSTFAVRNLSLPCAINGIAPDILFQFSARINLINPVLVVNCGLPVMDGADAAAAPLVDDDSFLQQIPPIISPVLVNPCTVNLVSTLSVEPVIHVQSVRRTLFCVNACEGLQPCQGSVLAAEIEDAIEDCEIGGIDRPDCRCSRRNDTEETTSETEDTETRDECHRHRNNTADDFLDNNRSLHTNIAGVGNQDIGGLTVGPGTCEDCVWGTPGGHSCRPRKPCGHRRDNTSDTSGRTDVAGIEGRMKRRHLNDVHGTTDKNFIRRLLAEVCEELIENTNDDAGTGFEHSRPTDSGNKRTGGENEHRGDKTRTTSQHHSSNGCSW